MVSITPSGGNETFPTGWGLRRPPSNGAGFRIFGIRRRSSDDLKGVLPSCWNDRFGASEYNLVLFLQKSIFYFNFVIKKELVANSFLDFNVFAVDSESYPPCVGENGKGVLVGSGELLDADLVDFLRKVLSAVGLDMEKDAARFVLTEPHRTWLWGYQAGGVWSRALLFGIPALRLGMNAEVEAFRPLSLEGRRLLFAPPLSVVTRDAGLKRSLWAGMQPLFA
ncbi:MAG: hypothetical protein RLY31_2018 [Bacteroidota bacterium]|jgi:hypothetical protein